MNFLRCVYTVLVLRAWSEPCRRVLFFQALRSEIVTSSSCLICSLVVRVSVQAVTEPVRVVYCGTRVCDLRRYLASLLSYLCNMMCCYSLFMFKFSDNR